MSIASNLLWNPIVAKEVRSRMRTWRAPMVMLAFLVILGAVGYTAYQSSAPGVTTTSDLGRVGRSVFDGLAGALITMVALIVPGLVGGSISGERERQTLDLLMVTPVRPGRIIIGKLLSSLLFVAFLVVATLPLFSIVFILGGVEASAVVAVVVVTLVTALVLGSLAMLCSALMRRTTASTVSSYIGAFLLVVAPLIVGALIATASSSPFGGTVNGTVRVLPGGAMGLPMVRGDQSNPPPPIIYMSPAAAMYGTLGGGGVNAVRMCSTFATGPGIFNGGTTMCRPSQPTSANQIPSGLFGGWTYWEAFTLVDSVVAVLLLLMSTLALRGRMPRQLRRNVFPVDA